jgi:benzoylformate decarboxylase
VTTLQTPPQAAPSHLSGPSVPAVKTGRHGIIEQFLADGLDHMFGNPGTVEQGFLDALEDYPDFKYILTLQEAVTVGIADGYARARGKPALIQLHSGVGTGNAVGMLYQALRGQAPLVVIAGEAGVQYEAMDAQMAVDLVAMTRPVTKYSTRVTHPANLLRVLRRAIKMAQTAPCGPVFVALPMDVLDAPLVGEVRPSTMIDTRAAPSPEGLAQAASWLAGAERPLILMGDGISASGAQAELQALAELLGASVYGVNSSLVNLSAAHPLSGGATGHMFGEVSRELVRHADAVLICGTYLFPEVFPDLERPFAPGARLIHIDLDTYEIAKNFDVDLALLGDPKAGLAGLHAALERQLSPAQRAAGQARLEAAQQRRSLGQVIPAPQVPGQAMAMDTFMAELARHLPDDVMVFDEALTNSPAVTRHLVPTLPGHLFQTRGGSLGVGIPGGVGVKLAHPDKTVIAFTGDGGSMYTIQALWTAAKYGVAAKFVICNNGSYHLLKLNIDEYWKEQGISAHAHPSSFDISQPVTDFVRVSEGLHVPALRVERPEEVAAAVKAMLDHDGPFLLDVLVSE